MNSFISSDGELWERVRHLLLRYLAEIKQGFFILWTLRRKQPLRRREMENDQLQMTNEFFDPGFTQAL